MQIWILKNNIIAHICIRFSTYLSLICYMYLFAEKPLSGMPNEVYVCTS